MLDLSQPVEDLREAVRPPKIGPRLLVAAYFGTIALLATLALVGHWYLGELHQQGVHELERINIAGRQRMYSQQVAKDVQILANPEFADRHEAILQSLTDRLDDWQRAHDILIYGDIELELPVAEEGEVRDVMAQARQRMDVMVDAAEWVMLNPDDHASVAQVIQMEAEYLPLAERAVELFQQRADTTTAGGNDALYLLLAGSMGLVLLELAMIFYPFVRWIDRLRRHDELLGDTVLHLVKQKASQPGLSVPLHAIGPATCAKTSPATPATPAASKRLLFRSPQDAPSAPTQAKAA